MLDITLLPSAKVPLIYSGDNTMTTEWYRFFWNVYGFTGDATGAVPVNKGGTGLTSIGDHQLIIGNSSGVFERTELVGSGITVTYAPGTVTLAIGNSGVTPGTYGSATNVGQFTVDIHGTLVFAQNVPIAIDASQIVSGTIASARISGSYTGITGVGTLTAGTWNADVIGAGYGGTGISSYAAGDLIYATGPTALSKLAIGTSTFILTSNGTAPVYTSPSAITVGTASNVGGGTANQIVYQLGAGSTSFIAAPTIADTYLRWTGSAFAWTANPLGDVVGPASATDNAISRFDGTTGKLIQNSAVNISDAGDIAGAGSIAFDGTNPPTPAPGTLWFESSTNTWNAQQNAITQQIGEEIFVYGKASNTITGETLLQAIVKTGTVGSSGVIQFGVAGAGITDVGVFIGVATENIATNGFGRITNFGVVHGINTSGSTYGETWADNDDIWYNPTTGGLTKTKPTAPGIKMKLGTVINAGPGGSGSFQVFLEYGSTLGGTDSNVQFGTLATNDLIQYNGTYWTNVAPSSISIGTATNADHVKTVSTATNANFYLTFVDSDNSVAAYESVYTDAGVTYNPSTNSITSGISGGTF